MKDIKLFKGIEIKPPFQELPFVKLFENNNFGIDLFLFLTKITHMLNVDYKLNKEDEASDRIKKVDIRIISDFPELIDGVLSEKFITIRLKIMRKDIIESHGTFNNNSKLSALNPLTRYVVLPESYRVMDFYKGIHHSFEEETDEFLKLYENLFKDSSTYPIFEEYEDEESISIRLNQRLDKISKW